jgi:hypothetical protein
MCREGEALLAVFGDELKLELEDAARFQAEAAPEAAGFTDKQMWKAAAEAENWRESYVEDLNGGSWEENEGEMGEMEVGEWE